MSTLTIEHKTARAKHIVINEDTLTVDLDDGRSVSAPIVWFPRLTHASAKERNNWRLIGDGEGIHWEDIDEDISIDNLLFGKTSGENQRSFKKWLAGR
ncbi:DUF2442 domain-containing protein [candidate division KSB1 bacterium]|nr:DUF2442 domain-containing protein [candidate division KSB1 bacterium]